MNEPALICFCYSRFVFSWICGLCYSDLCYSAFSDLSFPFSFPNTRKYFPENFLQCNQTPWKHFPFPEISISGKYVFSGKRFTATKHSLRHKIFHQFFHTISFLFVLWWLVRDSEKWNPKEVSQWESDFSVKKIGV